MSTSSGSSLPWLLAVDPGLRCVGVALFRGNDLVRAAALRGPATGRGPAVWSAYAGLVFDWVGERVPFAAYSGSCEVVVETMRHNAYGESVPVDDLLELAGVAGAIIGRLAADCWSPSAAPAHQWKGQVKRKMFAARVEGHLRAGDWSKDGAGWSWSSIEVPSRATELNDIMHAVGLGRWKLGL